MKPRPVHRWKSFWFGVLVIGFLGWAWWLSYGYHTAMGRGGLMVGQGQGYFQVAAYSSGMPEFHFHTPVHPGSYVFQFALPPFFARGEERPQPGLSDRTNYLENAKWAYRISPKDCWCAFIPYWLLVVLFAVPWAAFLCWRVRRQRRSIA